MKTKHASPLLALHLSMILVACGPNPTTPVNQPTGTTTATATPTPSGTTEIPTPSPTSIAPTNTPTTPASTSNPASGSSATVTLPNGSKLFLSLGNRFLEAKGQTIQLQASLVDVAGQPVPLSTLKLLFSSSRPQDISVSDSGLLTALVEQGFAEIIVRVDGSDLRATQLVSVNSAESFSGGGGGGASQPSPSPLEDLDVDVEFEGLGIGEFQVNTYTTSNQENPSIAMDSDGDFVVSWQSNGQDGSNLGIYAQRYNSTGIAQGSEFQVNTYTTNNQINSTITMDSDGDFVVSWQSYGQDSSRNGVYAQRYNSAGTAQGSEFRINTYTLDDQSSPSIAMDNDGDFVVSWQSYEQDSSRYGVYAQRYNSAGVAQGSEFQVNTHITHNQSNPAIAMDSDGDFVVTWTSSGNQDGDTYGVYAQRYNSAGISQGNEFQVNTSTTSTQMDSVIAIDSDGDFVISWRGYGFRDGNGVYAQRYHSTGVAQGNEFNVNTHTSDSQRSPAIAIDSDGNFTIIWESGEQDGDEKGIEAKSFNTSGQVQ